MRKSIQINKCMFICIYGFMYLYLRKIININTTGMSVKNLEWKKVNGDDYMSSPFKGICFEITRIERGAGKHYYWLDFLRQRRHFDTVEEAKNHAQSIVKDIVKSLTE